MDGQGTKRRMKIAENFNRLSGVHERYKQTTDRQTDRQTEQRQHIANVNMSSLKTLNPVNGRQCLILTADFNSDRYDSERMMMMIMMTTTIMSNSVSVLYTALLLLLVSDSK